MKFPLKVIHDPGYPSPFVADTTNRIILDMLVSNKPDLEELVRRANAYDELRATLYNLYDSDSGWDDTVEAVLKKYP